MTLCLAVTLVFLVSSLSSAQQSQPCKSPPYLTGQFFVTLNAEHTYWNYEYNTALQRMKMFQTEYLTNRSSTYDYLLHFGEGVMYEIDTLTSSCYKRPLRTHYQPIEIPDDAVFLVNWVFGSLSVPNAGLKTLGWMGYNHRGEEYNRFVTEVGCVPYHTIFQTEDHGEVIMVFMNSTMHTTAPDDLSPPRFCPNKNTSPKGKPVDFISLFSETKARDLRRALEKLKNVYLNNYSFS
ncbi:hypothetical protein WMY93_014904 [Mugilogobius chulae]|uniref:Uncharacterized protein n=1 Tax=Mugilogobius chulae TaxID=88201 RepID=A0AAW0P7X3_9GOBI